MSARTSPVMHTVFLITFSTFNFPKSSIAASQNIFISTLNASSISPLLIPSLTLMHGFLPLLLPLGAWPRVGEVRLQGTRVEVTRCVWRGGGRRGVRMGPHTCSQALKSYLIAWPERHHRHALSSLYLFMEGDDMKRKGIDEEDEKAWRQDRAGSGKSIGSWRRCMLSGFSSFVSQQWSG